MAHEVESMIWRVKTPWHGLGVQIGDDIDADGALIAAGMDYSVEKRPIFFEGVGGAAEVPPAAVPEVAEASAAKKGKKKLAVVGEEPPKVEAPASRIWLPAPAYATVRVQEGKPDRAIGVVKAGYQVLQNHDLVHFLDPFLEGGLARIETAGVLNEGARVWVLANLSADPLEIVKGDLVRKYLLLANSHDGTMAVRCGFTPIRVVCANTLAMARGHADSHLLKIFHSKHDIKKTLDQVREIMDVANQTFEATAEQYRALAKKPISLEDLDKYVSISLGLRPKKLKVETEADAKTKLMDGRVIEDVRELFQVGRGAEIAGVEGTLWGAYNAVVEYLQHKRGDEGSSRLNEIWFGHGARKAQVAFTEALKLAA